MSSTFISSTQGFVNCRLIKFIAGLLENADSGKTWGVSHPHTLLTRTLILLCLLLLNVTKTNYRHMRIVYSTML